MERDPRGALLGRDEFRNGVFARDRHLCVIPGCGRAAVDAHHIMERRLFTGEGEKSGYFLANGSSLCSEHHLAAEMTTISVEEIREACGIAIKVLPDHLYDEGDQAYTKWGDPILPNGRRLRGELFGDESVQKILQRGGVLDLYSHLVRFGRTYHEPASPGRTSDDRVHTSLDQFEGREIVITVKRDGGNTTVYPTGDFHGRSPDAAPHPAQGPARAEAARWQYDLPEGWRASLENLYRRHSIPYDDLPAWLLGIGIWDETNTLLDWDQTAEWFGLLDVPMVETMYRGPFDQRIVDAVRFDRDRMEGWVMRDAGRIPYARYPQMVAKHVRADHNHLHGSRHAAIVPNRLGPAGPPAWHFDAKVLGAIADTVAATGAIVR